MGESKTNDTYTFLGPMGVASETGFVENEPISIKIPVTMILLACMLMSIVGNVCTCAVIARNRSMRTATNCYLFNLAVTDFTTSLFVPIEIYVVWFPDNYPFGQVGCIIHFLIWDALSNCSLLTIAAFTVERYLAVSRPFLRQKLSEKSRVYKIVAANWLIASCFGIPDFFYIGVLDRNQQIFCYFRMPYALRYLIATEMFIFFVVPMTTIFVLYVLIALKIRSICKKQRSSPVNGKQYRDKTIIMLAAVAATFFFCWFPFFLLRLLMLSPRYEQLDYYNLWRIFRYICTINAYLYTAINPILYSLMSRKFWRAFKDLLKGRKMPYGNSIKSTYKCSMQLQPMSLHNT